MREWLEANCPDSMRTPYGSEADRCWGGRKFSFQSDDQRFWLERMADRGWTAPTWPREYGGGGLDKSEAKILSEEMQRIQARPPLFSFGLAMLGPALLKFGTDALKRQHIPPIVRGEIRWAQAYSEPNAGSDLASLQTRCLDMGDHFIINGSKIWTSYGDLSDCMFCLVRSDASAPKHQGISFVMFDMAVPGVSVRPIKLISGKSPFTEVFLDNVRVEKDQVVGEIDQGWTVAKYLLAHEREVIAQDVGVTGRGTAPISMLASQYLGQKEGMLSNTMLRADIARFEMDERALALTIDRVREEVKTGTSLGAASSIFKYYGAELNKRRNELQMAIYGADALDWEDDANPAGHISRDWLRSKGNSIEGGTSEIQLNIVAKRILGLPG